MSESAKIDCVTPVQQQLSPDLVSICPLVVLTCPVSPMRTGVLSAMWQALSGTCPGGWTDSNPVAPMNFQNEVV